MNDDLFAVRRLPSPVRRPLVCSLPSYASGSDTQNQQIEALKGRIETLEQEVAKTR